MTTAEQIAEQLGNDGQVWVTPEGQSFSDLIRAHHADIVHQDGYPTGGLVRYDFADGSAILEMPSSWDIGYQGCFCSATVGHDTNCER